MKRKANASEGSKRGGRVKLESSIKKSKLGEGAGAGKINQVMMMVILLLRGSDDICKDHRWPLNG